MLNERLQAFADRLAGAVLIAGGLGLVLVAGITVTSVIGRALVDLGLSPIRGDYEIVELVTAASVSAFFPWAQLRSGHADVSILTDLMGARFNAVLALVVEVLFLALSLFVLSRHAAAIADKFDTRESTVILRLSLGWGYALCLPGLALWPVACALNVWLKAAALVSDGSGRSAS